MRPPTAVLEQLKVLNQTHRIGHALCRSRDPDFLLEIIQRQVNDCITHLTLQSCLSCWKSSGNAIFKWLIVKFTIWLKNSLYLTVIVTQKSLVYQLPCALNFWLSAVATTRHLHISLTSFIGLTRRNHGIDYGPVPVHAWSFREPGSAPSATDHFVWLSHVHGTVFLPASQH